MKILAKLVRSAKLTNFYRDYSKRVQFNKCVSLNVIGSGAFGESPSICLSVAKDVNYLFNCGEDCHRLLNQFKIKISTIKHIFITQTKWNCIGGISGVGRTVNSTSGWLPMLHGPKQLYKCIKRILCLSILSELDFRPIDCNFNRFYENDHLRIEFISIKLNKRCDIRDEHEVFIYVAKLKDEKSTGSKSKYRAHFMSMDNEYETLYCSDDLLLISLFLDFSNRLANQRPSAVISYEPILQDHSTNIRYYCSLFTQKCV